MKVREWSWWRVYTRVLPLLPLNRLDWRMIFIHNFDFSVDDEHRGWAERVQKLEHMLAEMRKEKVSLTISLSFHGLLIFGVATLQ